MKTFYDIMILVSMICLAGDSESFSTFLIWHAVWLAVMAFFMYMSYKESGKA